MNAGGSEAGQAFAATQVDMNFVILKERDPEGGKAQIDHLKNMAREAGRDVKSWVHVYVVCRETEQEAHDYLNHYVVDKGDYEAVNNLLEIFGMQSETLPKEIGKLSDMGVDGMLISWVDYKTECKQWIDEIIPLMEQAGQREVFNRD
jgi:alkanesulfonate monooxygenase SsuD/methylene tetrahydromethanopterin reductase-like flavin-dependent oxidoreductase (luciferase family)